MTFAVLIALRLAAADAAGEALMRHTDRVHARCEAYAELHWHLAHDAGVYPDAAFEDAYAACRSGQ